MHRMLCKFHRLRRQIMASPRYLSLSANSKIKPQSSQHKVSRNLASRAVKKFGRSAATGGCRRRRPVESSLLESAGTGRHNQIRSCADDANPAVPKQSPAKLSPQNHRMFSRISFGLYRTLVKEGQELGLLGASLIPPSLPFRSLSNNQHIRCANLA
jgi:hypothetical protein